MNMKTIIQVFCNISPLTIFIFQYSQVTEEPKLIEEFAYSIHLYFSLQEMIF